MESRLGKLWVQARNGFLKKFPVKYFMNERKQNKTKSYFIENS